MTPARRSRLLARAAAAAEVPVFLVRGHGAGDADARLRASRRLDLLDSPRAATVLVVAGRVAADFEEALARVHDQMAHPRATVWWTGEPAERVAEAWSHATVVGPDGDIEEAVVDAHRDLLAGRRISDPPLLPDVDPVPWRGIGPFGHGGTGMTGGVPFGRPMAGRADDRRDGLALDVVPVRLGPFLPLLPAGMVLAVTFAGDVVHDVTVTIATDLDGGQGAALPDGILAPFLAARSRPVAIADLELARARSHLRWLARFVHLHGLDGLARRVARTSLAGRLEAAELVGLGRRLDRPWVLGRTTRGVGALTGDEAAAWRGPVARASGLHADARSEAPSYVALEFEPVVHHGGDIRDRWRQRLAEAVQAVHLATRAGAATVEPGEPLELPVPPPPEDAAQRLAGMLVGAEWGDALAILASIDPDLTAAGTTAASR